MKPEVTNEYEETVKSVPPGPGRELVGYSAVQPRWQYLAACGLLALMLFLAGGSAMRRSVMVDEVAFIGSGLSYLQTLDLRLNAEHPPLAKLWAAVPLALTGAHADYSGPAWKGGRSLFGGYMMQWPFGDSVVGRWNPWRSTLFWARLPMMILTLLLGWSIYTMGVRLGGGWGGLLCLAAYVSTPAFLAFGPLVLTDTAVAFCVLWACWRFGELWRDPSRKNALLFGLAVAAALMTKFTGLLLFLFVPAFFLWTRFRPGADEPEATDARKQWRKLRSRAARRGMRWALLFTYVTYFILTWNQSDELTDRLGTGVAAHMLVRVLAPLYFYLRGVALMLITAASRPTYLFGRTLPHGVPYYFPVVFALKSTLAFLVLLLLAGAAALLSRHSPKVNPAYKPHWRAMIVGLLLYLAICLASQLDISIRHFTIPIVFLILLLAPLPNVIAGVRYPQMWQGMTAALAGLSLLTVIWQYPNYFPYVNALSFGHSAYESVNDSNVSWNGALPDVEEFVQEHHLRNINLDFASLSDPALVVPQAQPWDCQLPTAADAGSWSVVAAVSLKENRNCDWLLNYPKQAIAGGDMYAFHLPTPIPEAGTPGGPPVASARRQMWGMGTFDLRAWALDLDRHPEHIERALAFLYSRMAAQRAAKQ